ncbi:MAG: outer membrane lipoprotein carrier protein LolA [Rhodoferax sp.]|uniref:LolA-related protein n=1 Tax=Rhodoferax sp. TaxID=50421 RepID=UPI0018299D06|nr:LolA-related protein [Rhodoferax sp.]NMM14272.1 outer membrane lipoprotein carrier protein LolA [Rhodoferax sp.]NMM19594.1 outer membrane lipoprotein carrier protein LolA [Rhodoferax sp.]
MIFTRSHLRPLLGLFAGLLVVVLSAPSYAADWDLDQLMNGLAQTRSGHARFVEKKSIAILEQPVESSGDLLYTAPDRLEKRTLKPKLETMVVNGDNLQIERGRQKIQLQLQTYPELTAFIDSIRGTLAGDRKALERSYQLSLEGAAQGWTLKLVPLDSKMKQVVALIRITGVRDELRSIHVTQVDGDSSVMQIEKVATP